MPSARLVVLGSSLAVLLGGCLLFIDNPDATSSTTTSSAAGPGGAGGMTVDAGTDSGDAGDAGETLTLCKKYGDYHVVEKVVGDAVGTIVADCRINPVFLALTPARQKHLADCLTKQVAVVMHCDGIKYDVDSEGVECRDMKVIHKGMGVRHDDFVALVDDVGKTLAADGIEAKDIGTMAAALNFLEGDIVTNSAPDFSKPCDAGVYDAGDGG